jgi:lipoprotein-releasing system permease protein
MQSTALIFAKRYFLAKNKSNFVNILTIISVVGLAFGTTALVIVLSVFNGLEQLTRSLHTTHNPALKIVPKKGKTFHYDSLLAEKIRQNPKVAALTSVIEDNALARYGDAQRAVKFKGVEDNFKEQYPLEDKVVAGSLSLKKGNLHYALLGLGVQASLSVSVSEYGYTPLMIWYPKKDKITNPDPLKAFNQEPVMPGGVISIEQQFDNNTLIVPLEFALKLTEYEGKRTSLEVKPKSENDLQTLKNELQEMLGDTFLVQDRDEQQLVILRAFKIERLFAFVTFSFILAIASFNIFFSLTMLAVEKQKDMAVLKSLGASPKLIRNIFLLEGGLIAGAGAVTGIILGYVICFLQQTFGFVSFGIESALISAYPVEMRTEDFFAVLLLSIFVTVLSSFVPALRASRIVIKDNLSK